MYRTLLGSLFVSVVSALWPVPRTYSHGTSTVVLAQSFDIEFVGPNATGPECVDTSKKVADAIDRAFGLLNDGFVPRMLHPFGEDFEPSIKEMTVAHKLQKLVITQRS
jgi:hexosaminidase